eukprot:5140228-Alexandrium_andersonii.AAC.1
MCIRDSPRTRQPTRLPARPLTRTRTPASTLFATRGADVNAREIRIGSLVNASEDEEDEPLAEQDDRARPRR